MPKQKTNQGSTVDDGTTKTQSRRASSASNVIQFATEYCELFHTPDREAYASVVVDDHREVYALDSSEFKSWIDGAYFKKHREGISASALDAAITTLTANAKYAGKQKSVYLRTAHRNGKYYVDLADKDWRVVEIDATGWRVLARSPVKFTRRSAMRALPFPMIDGKFKSVLKFTNIPAADWILVLTWLIECLRPETPYVGLALIGPQGSAKSTTQSFLRDLIDPSRENLRVKPRSVSDMFVAAGSSHLVSYENLSKLPDDMQDGMCSILTGAGFAGRKLFTNDQETVITLKRPVALNGIAQVVTRPDLLDRFVVLMLPPITDKRQTEAELARGFQKERGQIFGAILTRFSKALAQMPEVIAEKHSLPRMADFALLGEAVSRSLNLPKGQFIERFTNNQRRNVELAIDETPVGAAIQSYLATGEKMLEGLYVKVSEVLRQHWLTMPQARTSTARWPGTGKAFGDALSRLQGSARHLGIVIEAGKRTAQGYVCRICRAPD